MYTVQPCIYETTKGDVSGFLISKDDDITDSDLFYVNRYLHTRAIGSKGTSRQYAYRLLKFIKFLQIQDKTIMEATDEDIVHYLHSLQYDLSSDIVSIKQRISPYALACYYYPLRGFFIYLYTCGIAVNVNIQLVKSRNGKNSYLQGIAQAMPVPDLVLDNSFRLGASAREYIRWYTPEQKENLLDGLRTKRDKAVLSIGMDGFRIDEILSSQMDDYNVDTGILTPQRSKRKPDGSEMRSAPLSERSLRLLNDYLLFERAEVERELYDAGRQIADEIFVVLRHDKYLGTPLSYRSFLKTLKSAARRAGFDEQKIRTHSGRSTRANEVFSDWSENPEKWTEREIMDLFGWKSMNSAEPYVNHNDKRRQKAVVKKLQEIDTQIREKQRKKRKKENERKNLYED